MGSKQWFFWLYTTTADATIMGNAREIADARDIFDGSITIP